VKFSNDTSGTKENRRGKNPLKKKFLVCCRVYVRARKSKKGTNEKSNKANDEWPSHFFFFFDQTPSPLFHSTRHIFFLFSPSSTKLAFITNRKWQHISPMRKQQKKKMRNNFSIDKARSNKVCTKEEEKKRKTIQ